MRCFKELPKALERYRDKPIWVNWKRRRKGNGFTKPPYQPANPRLYAEPDNPQTWGSFEQALANVEENKADGLGICILGAEQLVAVDGDNCVRDDGSLEPAALRLIERYASYAEISPSGKGIRIFALSDGGPINRKQPVPGANGMSVEIARKAAKFFTITGNKLPNAPDELNQANGVSDEIVAALDAQKKEEEEEEEDQRAHAVREVRRRDREDHPRSRQ
jgi:primase-polymerase (primpol)-like protein